METLAEFHYLLVRQKELDEANKAEELKKLEQKSFDEKHPWMFEKYQEGGITISKRTANPYEAFVKIKAHNALKKFIGCESMSVDGRYTVRDLQTIKSRENQPLQFRK